MFIDLTKMRLEFLHRGVDDLIKDPFLFVPEKIFQRVPGRPEMVFHQTSYFQNITVGKGPVHLLMDNAEFLFGRGRARGGA